ncbi:DUF4407 domain-containing protein [Nocardia caishijiensis]|uniref:Uncharacterized protein DUF4407 n=1 Tax=Nocardia caishijiensis TaxID=184756 RepID=A0ABQ6YVQ8_9NOCA|nr:DUF4407 domain-containing protein [Nocardia caishijiensis]KAF0849566.1 uncharacterized protein DUF4407 [Nocardia caishijiensis]
MTGTLAWLGGGLGTPARDDNDDAGYVVTGAAVALFAVVAGLVTAVALAAADGIGFFFVAVLALLAAVAAGAIGRALATRNTTDDRRGTAARIGVGVGVLAGVVVAELATTVLLGGTVDRELDVRAHTAAETAPAVVTARAEYDLAVADRAALDTAIATAQADIDRNLVIARCEFNPTPECPQTRITGVPGRGPEAQTANDMLDDARKQLAAAQARTDGLDQRVRAETTELAAARTAAFAAGDRGIGARWLAMNGYSADHLGGAALRLAMLLVGIALALLPLLLRWWRGETALDRKVAAEEIADRAERAADAAIAVKQAEVRTEAAVLRAEQELDSQRLAIEADGVIDRERQRTRIIAAIGGFELGYTEPQRKDESVALEPTPQQQLPAGYLPQALPHGQAGALVPAEQAPPQAPTGGGLELPIIGTVPFTDTAARWIRPLVPSFVANAIDSATHPLRTARQAFEEVEEVTFTLRRSRKVTVDTQDSQQQFQQAPQPYQLAPGQQGYLPPGYPQPQYNPYAQQIAANVVDAPGRSYHPDPRQYPGQPSYTALPAGQGSALPAAGQGELGGSDAPELPGGHQRQLPPAR